PATAAAARSLARRPALGASVAPADFGTGHASLHCLQRLPIDVPTLDRSFITGLPDDPCDLASVQAIVGLARCTGIDVVAEGVETQAQANTLRECGVERAQGFLFSKAVEPALLVHGFEGSAVPVG